MTVTDPIDVANIAINIAISIASTPDVSTYPLSIDIHSDATPGGNPNTEASVGHFVFADLSGLTETAATYSAASDDGSGATTLAAGDYWVVFNANVRAQLVFVCALHMI